MWLKEWHINRFKGIWQRPVIASVIVFFFLFVSLVGIYAISHGDPRPDDHYFHFKYAYLLRTEGWERVVENFDWIYLSGHAEGSRYNVSLYQIALIPFTYIDDHSFAISVADAFFVSVLVAIFYYYLRIQKVRYPLFFTFLLVGSTFFMTRFLLGRAFVLMVGFVFLEMLFAIRKKYISLLVVTILHVLWHQMTYFLPLLIIGIVEVSRYITLRRVAVKSFIIGVVGIVGGMAFFSGFPGSLIGLLKWLFFLQNNASGGSEGAMGGVEMLTTDVAVDSVGQVLAATFLIFCFFAVAYVFYLYKKKGSTIQNDVSPEQFHGLLSMSIFLVFALFASIVFTGRFFDFVFPGYVILIALTFTILFNTKIIHAKVFEDRYFKVISVLALIIFCAYSFFHIHQRANDFDFSPAQEMADWIAVRAEPGEHVYLHNWSFFVFMFFANSDNVYSMGLEPATLKAYDEELYWKQYNIFRHKYYCEKNGDCGKDLYNELMVERTDMAPRNQFKKENSEKVITAIKNDFDARFVFSESREFSGMLLLSPELIADHHTTIFTQADGTKMQFSVFELK
jgi:hypothetical protein